MSRGATALHIGSFAASVRRLAPSIQIQTEGLDPYAIDGVAPLLAVRAKSADDVRVILTEAHNNAAAVVPRGGGQHVGMANGPARYDVALLLDGVDRVLAHEPADMTVMVEPGVRLADLQQRLAQHGQFLPLDPAAGAAATIGGVLAANASGPLRHAFGTARDWLIGVRVVHGDGSASKSGGRVVKNVAGYDMHKLHVGAHGTLGVIVEATFKLAPLPTARRTLVVSCASPRAACEVALAAWDAGLALRRLEVLSPAMSATLAGDGVWTLLVETAGGAGAVDRSERDLRSMAASRGAGVAAIDDVVWSRWSQEFRPRDLALRVTVLPSQVGTAILAIAGAASPSVALSATVAAGVVRARIGSLDDDAAVALVERLRPVLPQDAALAVESASPAVKRAIDVFGPTRADFAIMRSLKEQFDPRGVLAPGRFLGRL